MSNRNGMENTSLLIELESIQNRGVTIWLEDVPSSPLTVMDVLNVNENQLYMRDYVTDERGILTDLRFDRITKY